MNNIKYFKIITPFTSLTVKLVRSKYSDGTLCVKLAYPDGMIYKELTRNFPNSDASETKAYVSIDLNLEDESAVSWLEYYQIGDWNFDTITPEDDIWTEYCLIDFSKGLDLMEEQK